MATKGVGPRTAARIFKTLWRNPGMSRVDIADRLGLDKSTVTNQVNRLLELGLVVETEEGEASSKGGRRPIRLDINKDFGRFIGIEIRLDSYVAVLVDLAGGVREARKGHAGLGGDFAEGMLAVIGEVAEAFGGGPGLLGIGVGVGGLVDSKKSRVRYSVPLGLDKPLDFGKSVAARLAHPCFVENDANCCAWGELSFGRSEELRDILFALVEYRTGSDAGPSPSAISPAVSPAVSPAAPAIAPSASLGVGIGVGFGVVLGGKVHTGAHGNAGEFRSVFCDGPGELQFAVGPGDIQRLDRDPAVLARVADELARNMAMLVNTMDFERVFIGGDIESLDVDMPAVLRRRLEENWMYPAPKGVDIRYSSLGDRAVAYGAAGMVFDRLVSERLLPGLGSD